MENDKLKSFLINIAKKNSFYPEVKTVNKDYIEKIKDTVFDSHEYKFNGPFNDLDWIRYSYERLICRENIKNIFDVRIFFIENKKIYSIFELTIYQEKKKYKIVSRGTEISPFVPYFSNNAPKRVIKKTIELIKELNNFFEKKLNINKIYYNYPLLFNKNNNKYNLLLRDVKKFDVKLWSIVNLDFSVEEIKSEFRKSYKSVINNNKNNYELRFINYKSDSIENSWKDYRDLHFKEAGGLTRSEYTWEIQKKMLLEKKAFLILLYKKDITVAAAFVYYNQYYGFYFSGAFDKSEKRNHSLNHICQFKIIEHLKKIGVKCYLLGEYFINNKAAQDKKKYDISYHKFGFANELLNQISISY